jgi:hypothetical protein
MNDSKFKPWRVTFYSLGQLVLSFFVVSHGTQLSASARTVIVGSSMGAAVDALLDVAGSALRFANSCFSASASTVAVDGSCDTGGPVG